MEGWQARWAVGVFGAATIIFAVVIRVDRLSTWLLLTGLVLIVVPLLGPAFKLFKVSKDGVEVEAFDRAEGGISLDLANPEHNLDDYTKLIDSDDPSPPQPSSVDTEVIGGLNYAAGEIALDAILDRAVADGPLAGCRVYLYLFDPEEGALFPAAGDGNAVTHWKPGHGATGTAYARQEYVVVTGPMVSDDTYGLSADQQDRYRDLAVVASTPVWNARGEVIAVLTATSEDVSSLLSTPGAELALVETSLLVSRILVELLQWFGDGR